MVIKKDTSKELFIIVTYPKIFIYNYFDFYTTGVKKRLFRFNYLKINY